MRARGLLLFLAAAAFLSAPTSSAASVDLDVQGEATTSVPSYGSPGSAVDSMDRSWSNPEPSQNRKYCDDGSDRLNSNRVKLSYGAFTGFTFSPFNDNTKVRVHLGIPYAQAPVGNLRFLGPRPILKDMGDRNATSFGATCIQAISAMYPYGQSEDCLFVNVFAPAKIPRNKKLPVMVWIHGGGFDSGTTTFDYYNGSTMVHRSIEAGQDVVVVSFNYRLGLFGFLASPEIQAAGGSNAALRDQIAAFRWVRENIGAFGGDSSKVTAFGQSAGSVSIVNHMTATLPASDSTPLFDAAILESGGAHFGFTFNWTTVYGTVYNGLAATTKCANLTCLQALPADTLRTVQSALEKNGASFRPYIDGDYISSNPQKRLLNGDFMNIPILVGTNTNEGSSTVTTVDDYNSLLAKSFPGLPQSIISTAYALYPLSNYNSSSFGTSAAPYLAASDLLGDVSLQCPSQRVADAYSLLSKAIDRKDGKPLVYRYHFNHLPTAGIPDSQLIRGVGHGYEVPYVFGSPATLVNTNETSLAKEMVSMWTFFARSTGKKGMNGWKGQTIDWPKYEASAADGAGGGLRYRIDAAGSYAVEVDNVRTAKCNFWKSVTAAISSP
ncbi:Alpha/Beta hydrolase protein [Zopfochytrium polystomum]|nr:Alpha/Beta hydrolase protein [Zopfochytrium polystomum]